MAVVHHYCSIPKNDATFGNLFLWNVASIKTLILLKNLATSCNNLYKTQEAF